MRARGKNHRLHDKWWSLIRIPVKAVWSASFPLTPYRGVLNRLSIAHCKALGESCLLSHKSSSWGVVGRSYGRQKKMANGTMKMVKASLNIRLCDFVTGKRGYIVALSRAVGVAV